jgi:hypothetical protein
MKNLLALAAFVALLFLAVGWFQGWYRVTSTPSDNGQKRVIIDVDSQKIKHDLDTGHEKVKKILNKDGQEVPAPQLPSSPPGQTGVPAKPPFPTTTSPVPPPPPPAPKSNDGFFVLPAPSSPNSTSPAPKPGMPQDDFSGWFAPKKY